MQLIKSTTELKNFRQKSQSSLAFIPTMGALHAGHLSLVSLGQQHAEQSLVSIFVNPTQFGPGEDLDKYPRTLEEDLTKLKALGTTAVFVPSVADIYPEGLEAVEKIPANPELASVLCGKSRPGHFDGVCTVVKRLFDLVQANCAIFGEKDYQQLMIIKDMAAHTHPGLKIISGEIVREENGLALSSRNKYLSDSEKHLAAELYKSLKAVTGSSSQAESGNPYENETKRLNELGFEIEYLEEHWDRVFIAAKLGQTRLIDNLAY